jgi:hypothetical protein
MRTSEQINEIAAALAKAQGAIEGAVKGSLNPHFKNKYADLGAVWDACREHLSANNISVIQPVCHGMQTNNVGERRILTVTRLMHGGSGQWIEDDGIPLILSKDDMQGLGSALTYSRRYGLMAMVGIAPEDDDGNAASQKTHAQAEVVPAMPLGFQAWWEGAQDTAAEGSTALGKLWAAARPEYRQYVDKALRVKWEALKGKAEKAPAKVPVSA